MPSLAVKVYSLFYKYHLRQQLQSLALADADHSPSDPFGITSRAGESAAAANPTFQNGVAAKDIHVDPMSSLSLRIFLPESVLAPKSPITSSSDVVYGGYSPPPPGGGMRCRKLPVMLQFHGGGFVTGSNVSAANDAFCRRMARLCDVIVVAVGYRLAPESRFPAAFEDGFKVLNWLGKQSNLATLRNVRNSGVNHRRMFDSFGESMAEPWLAAHGDPSR